jgi:adenosine deaminase
MVEHPEFMVEHPEFMVEHPEFMVNFIIMATRHKSRDELADHVDAAVLYSQTSQTRGARVVGFDLAGQEEEYDPAIFQDDFMPLHRHFLNITIHAGEMADEDKIWQALYLLHAKRIGHGLKLRDNRKMMDFVRDHGLALEMCPSSNYQTNEFLFFPEKKQNQNKIYPLTDYLAHGIEVTINTDNRFISHTTMSGEYWQAAAMSQGGLSKWQILKLLRSSFQASFLPKDEKDILLKKIDDEIFSLLSADYFPSFTV